MSYKMCMPSLATADCSSSIYEDEHVDQNIKERTDVSDGFNEGESCNSTEITNSYMDSLATDSTGLDLRTSQLELLLLQESDTLSSNVCLGDWQTHVVHDIFESERVEAYITSLREVVDVQNQHLNMNCVTQLDTSFTDMMVGNVSPKLQISDSHSIEKTVLNSHQTLDIADECVLTNRCSGFITDGHRSIDNIQPLRTDTDIFDVISNENNQNILYEKENQPNYSSYRKSMPSGAQSCMKPSGIGLHLNSLIHSMCSQQPEVPPQINRSTSVLRNVRTMTITPASTTGKHFPFRSSSGYISTPRCKQGVVVSLVKKPQMENYDFNTTHVASSMKSAPRIGSVTLGISKVDDNVSSVVGGKPAVMAGQKRPFNSSFYQNDFERTEVSTQSICQTKKRKPSSTNEKPLDSCKRCNCKRSKCLKLYCECFAAGVYCGNSCTCTECLNRPETEDKVMEARQLIETRNPLAFAPKIVRSEDTPPITHKVDISDASASGRHKRGCNCKRSQCLKKYCECYQAGVGCSDSCRCDGCKNTYGKKERFSQLDVLPKVSLAEEVDVMSIEERRKLSSLKYQPSTTKDIIFQSSETLHIFTTGIDSLMKMQVGDCATPSISEKNCNPAENAMTSYGFQLGFESPLPLNEAKQCPTQAKCQGTPATPMFSPSMLDTARDDASFFRESETPLNQLHESTVTPELLKDDQADYSSFACLLNSSSPGHKRVTLSHQQASRSFHKGVQAQRIKSGRKLILQSIPAAPPSPIPINL